MTDWRGCELKIKSLPSIRLKKSYIFRKNPHSRWSVLHIQSIILVWISNERDDCDGHEQELELAINETIRI